MASHIEYWNANTLEMSTSRDKYEELHSPVEYDEVVGDYYRCTETRRVTGYLHERTGLITTDIRKFEKWLKKVEGK